MKNLLLRLATLVEVFEFFKKDGLWWLIPPVGILLILGSILALSHGTIIAPFIYPLF